MRTQVGSSTVTASSIGVPSRFAVTRVVPMPSVIELPEAFSSPAR